MLYPEDFSSYVPIDPRHFFFFFFFSFKKEYSRIIKVKFPPGIILRKHNYTGLYMHWKEYNNFLKILTSKELTVTKPIS
jgi:hypothetical protein